MSVVDEFLEHYEREIDHFTAVAAAVQRRLELRLATHGIRAIVTSRAKALGRLRKKVETRNRKKPYRSTKSIYDDIIDLAGARVALYFPGDRDQVGAIIQDTFEPVRAPKSFPEPNGRPMGKRFDGYVATHYLVKLKAEDIAPSEARYLNTPVEVQVASVLMHAWSEVEHDLEYKPDSGELSEDESAILDELNGLVLAGEIALERLQKAIQRRVGKKDVQFRDQFDLASFLSQRAQKEGMNARDVGRVDALFEGLRFLKWATPEKVHTLAAQLSPDDKKRPIADVLIDRLLSTNQRRKKLAAKISAILSAGASGAEGDKRTRAIGSFLTEWQELERVIRQLADIPGSQRNIPFLSALEKAKLPNDLEYRLRLTWEMRNRIVHGTYTLGLDRIEELAGAIKAKLVPAIRKLIDEREKHPKRLVPPKTS